MTLTDKELDKLFEEAYQEFNKAIEEEVTIRYRQFGHDPELFRTNRVKARYILEKLHQNNIAAVIEE